jgi:hypothetical protein
MSTAQSTLTLEALAARVGELERANRVLREEHADEVADLKRQIARLRAQRISDPEAEDQRPARIFPASLHRGTSGHRAQPTRRTSRRTLLQLGGAAAAATVAAGLLVAEGGTAASATPMHPDTIGFHQSISGSGNIAIEGDGTSGADGIHGTSDTSYGVQGFSASGAGVQGFSTSGAAVNGTSTTGDGVQGSTSSGTGVIGSTVGGVGVNGISSSGIGGIFQGGRAPLALGLAGSPGAPTSGTHTAGEIYLDNAAVMWICTGGGTPGTWKQAAAIPSSSFVTLQQSASGGGHTAIEGDGTSGAVGVAGTSDNNYGVIGTSTAVGVYGTSSGYVGVSGYSPNWVGVRGEGTASTGVGGWFVGGRAPLALGQGGAPGAPTTGGHFIGDIYLDSTAVVWVCIATGTPGSWVRLTSVANGTSGGAMQFLPGIARIVGAGNPPGVQLNVGSPQSFAIAGVGGIPANATGVFGNATVYGSSPNATGFISVFPAGGTSSGGSLNFTAGDEPLSNFVATGLGTGGQITVATFASGCKFIYDAVGYTL